MTREDQSPWSGGGGTSVCSGAMEDKSRETGREWSAIPFKTFYTKKDHVVTTLTETSEKGTINN